MKLDQVFGVLLILLAIYLAVNSVTREDVDGGLFSGGDTGSDGGLFSGGDSGADPGTAGDGDTTGGGDAGGDTTASKDTKNSNRSKTPSKNNEPAIAGSDFCAAAPGKSAYSDLGRANDAAIRCVEAAGLMSGRSGSQFDPGSAVTRGQAAEAIAAMIDRANELETKGIDLRELPSADDARFEDITADTPHRLAIARLNETPILQGYVDARYEPRGRVRRAQMASLLDRAYQFMNRAALPKGRDRFRDDDRSVHEESINAVAGVDIMNGIGNRRFAPRRSVRRGELASYLALMLVRMEDKNRIMPLSDTPTK
ncbi:hypothetical protein BH23ACT10_BH23ACT10_31860 [soil metagenome]